jgi:alpha-tubulin suppressor-like RCC1 family protein
MLATKTDGTLWAWGGAGGGQLGQNSNSPNRSSPTQIPGTQWARIAAGRNISVVIQSQ